MAKSALCSVIWENERYAVPVFGGSWKGRWEGEEWRGHWTDSLRPGDYRVPLTLTPLVNPRVYIGVQNRFALGHERRNADPPHQARFRVGHHFHADR